MSPFASCQGEFLGLGGNVWPIDSDPDAPASTGGVHEEMLSKREYLKLRDGREILVIADIEYARRYLKQAWARGIPAVLLGVSDRNEGSNQDGYDFGDPEGGYSLVESEMLVAERVALLEKYIDPRNGLFRNLDEMQQCLDEIPDGEDLDSYCAVAICRIE